MSNPAQPPERRLLLRHGAIHLLLVGAFFYPGCLIWNRPDVIVWGLPLSILTCAVLIPWLIAANMAWLVVSSRKRDQAFMEACTRAKEGARAADEAPKAVREEQVAATR